MDEADTPDSLSSRTLWALGAGAAIGVLLRLAFHGGVGERWAPMMGSFVFLVPIAVAAVTIYVAERQERRSWGFYAGAGALANVFFVIGTLCILIEGLICAILIVPLFAVVGAIAGLVVGAAFRIARWPRQATYCLAVLPLVAGGIEPRDNLPVRTKTIERTIQVAAPREVVWAQLFDVAQIREEEVNHSIAARIGVPTARSAVMRAPGVRRVSMTKQVYFDQIAIERRDLELIRWRHRFYSDSFPPYAFDQHVVMGGEYFDVEEASYRLHEQGGVTQLTIQMRYRVSTRFNWYADAVARLVLGNLEGVILEVYRARAEGAI